jgi:hypothetical protein
MSDPIWQIGPPGLLKPLFCPEDGVDITVERYGGIHQNLSGARTMDITGRRQKIEMSWHHLEISDYKWLRSLHMGELPGPYRLISPLSKNRLTSEASLCKVASGTRRGWYPEKGTGLRDFSYPSTLTEISQSTRWQGRLANWAARWDNKNMVTVIPGEQITFSVYMKSATAFLVHLGLDWYDRSQLQISPSADSAPNTPTAWTRLSVTATVPANVAMCRPYLYTSNVTDDIYLAAAQLELGAAATSWELGGGAPVVLFDQLSDASARYGYHDLTATFLEA